MRATNPPAQFSILRAGPAPDVALPPPTPTPALIPALALAFAFTLALAAAEFPAPTETGTTVIFLTSPAQLAGPTEGTAKLYGAVAMTRCLVTVPAVIGKEMGNVYGTAGWGDS